MPRLLFGMKPLPEESQESKDWKKGRKRFFFEREHDVYLYYLTLEAAKWDEAKDDLAIDFRGNVVMDGGWEAVATAMNERFETKLNKFQCAARMKLLEDKGERDGPFFNLLFDEAMDLRDHLERSKFWGKAAAWFARERSSGSGEEDGLVEHEILEADGPRRDRDPSLP